MKAALLLIPRPQRGALHAFDPEQQLDGFLHHLRRRMRPRQLQADLIQQLQRLEARRFGSLCFRLMRFGFMRLLQRPEVDRAGLDLPRQAAGLLFPKDDLVRADGDHIAAVQRDGRRDFLLVDEGAVHRASVAKRGAPFGIPLDHRMAAGYAQFAVGENHVIVAGPAQRQGRPLDRHHALLAVRFFDE